MRQARLIIGLVFGLSLIGVTHAAADDATPVRPLGDVAISIVFQSGDDRALIVLDGDTVKFESTGGTEGSLSVVFTLDAESQADLFATFTRSDVLDYALDATRRDPDAALLIEVDIDEDNTRGAIELRVQDVATLTLEESAGILTRPGSTTHTLEAFRRQLAALALSAHRRQTP